VEWVNRLSRMNRREESVFGNQMLPPGYEFVYASGDRGAKDYIGNQMIVRCDKLATHILRRVAASSEFRDRLRSAPGDRWVAAGLVRPRETTEPKV
jgi:hypothetical protein